MGKEGNYLWIVCSLHSVAHGASSVAVVMGLSISSIVANMVHYEWSGCNDVYSVIVNNKTRKLKEQEKEY